MCVWGRWGVGGKRRGESQRCGRLRGRGGGLTGAHVEFRAAHAVVSGWTVVKTLPVLPHPLPPQKQEEFGLAVYTAVVSGAHRAAFTDGVRSIASCRTNTEEYIAKVINTMEVDTYSCQYASTKVLVECLNSILNPSTWGCLHQLLYHSEMTIQ